mgnify:CR=1 FL=1
MKKKIYSLIMGICLFFVGVFSFSGCSLVSGNSEKKGEAIVMKIGDKLKSGKPHDGRAPDYDDWTLNGDIVLYFPLLDCAFEISSMGIRVDEASLDNQLNLADKNERREFDYHKQILNGTLPLTIGGGIGQSRLCMLLLGRAHIGEVQASYWDKATLEECEELKIELL